MEVAVLPLMVPPLMVKVPSTTYTPPEMPFSPFALLLVTLALPSMVKVPPLTYTPPPLVAVLLVMVPPYMLNLLFPPLTYTPPPRCVAVSPVIALLPVMVPPYILKMPPFSTFTPLPEPSP